MRQRCRRAVQLARAADVARENAGADRGARTSDPAPTRPQRQKCPRGLPGRRRNGGRVVRRRARRWDAVHGPWVCTRTSRGEQEGGVMERQSVALVLGFLVDLLTVGAVTLLASRHLLPQEVVVAFF